MSKNKIKDLTGLKFGRLTVLKRADINSKNGHKLWVCQCECGGEPVLIRGDSLKRGASKSCGCLNSEKVTTRSTTHGLVNTRLYRIYTGMKNRCISSENRDYHRYGGRGITVCEEWLDEENGFINFYNWSIENGYNEKLSIDRKDVNGNYEPSNCRWATSKEQQNNKRNNAHLNIDGEEKTISQWADESGIHKETIRSRVKKNPNGQQDLLSTPRKKQKSPNQSGTQGIIWTKSLNKWRVRVNIDGKYRHIGYYFNLEDAINAKNNTEKA